MFWNGGPTTTLIMMVALVLLFFSLKRVDSRLDAIEAAAAAASA
jgi:hypothetical protein